MVIIDRWKRAWRLPAFRTQFLWSAPVLLSSLIMIRVFLEGVEVRSGITLDDPFLALISPVDLKWITFALTYSAILLGITALSMRPFAFLLLIRALVIMVIFRIISLLLLPLDPPSGIIPLVDPLVQLPFSHAVLTRDLFFSWHTGVIAVLAFTTRGRDLRIILAVLTVVVAILLLLQHAQYTIGVIAAPCFAYASYGVARFLTAGGNSGLTVRLEEGV